MLAAIAIARRQGGRKRCFQSPRYNRTIMALRSFKRTTAAASTNKSPLSKCLRQKQENQHERFRRLPSHNHQESHSLHRGRSSASTPMSGIRYDTAEEHHHRILIDQHSCQFRITLPNDVPTHLPTMLSRSAMALLLTSSLSPTCTTFRPTPQVKSRMSTGTTLCWELWATRWNRT